MPFRKGLLTNACRAAGLRGENVAARMNVWKERCRAWGRWQRFHRRERLQENVGGNGLGKGTGIQPCLRKQWGSRLGSNGTASYGLSLILYAQKHLATSKQHGLLFSAIWWAWQEIEQRLLQSFWDTVLHLVSVSENFTVTHLDTIFLFGYNFTWSLILVLLEP